MFETRGEKFKRLATYRTNLVIDKLRVLGNLSNKSNYEYTEDEINKIFNAIDSQLRLIKTKFKHKTTIFKLS
jgi:hypothetical protein